MDALAVEGVRVLLGGATVLDDVSVTARAGEVLGVVGANGSGKTTLLRAGLGLVRLDAGEVRLAGRPVAGLGEVPRSRLAAYLPQARRISWNLPAWHVAALGAPELAQAHARERATAALDDVGMAALAERGVLDMSGGERARVLLARLIVTGAPLLVADEPAAGLDPDGQFQVMEVLTGRAARGAAVVVSLHDLTLAARACDRIAVLAAGRLVALGAPAQVLTAAVLEQAFMLEGRLTPTPFGPVIVARRHR